MCLTVNMEVSSSCRKVRKPLMEKKRRERINHSLNELKRLIVEASSKDEAKVKAAKLEKADILDLAVKHVQYLHDKYQISKHSKVNPTEASRDDRLSASCGRTSSAEGLRERLANGEEKLRVKGVTRLSSGEIALVITSEPVTVSPSSTSALKPSRLMWRPW